MNNKGIILFKNSKGDFYYINASGCNTKIDVLELSKSEKRIKVYADCKEYTKRGYNVIRKRLWLNNDVVISMWASKELFLKDSLIHMQFV